jgi:hypothetical protein
MKLKAVYCALLISGLGACAPSSDSKKNSDGPVQTTTNEEAKVATDTRVCDDTSKQLNPNGTFETISETESKLILLTTRMRLADNNNGTGTLIVELSCSGNGFNAASVKGQVPYRRSGSTIETLQEIKLQSPQGVEGSCSVNGSFPKATLNLATKNSCLIIEAGGQSVTLIPSLKSI